MFNKKLLALLLLLPGLQISAQQKIPTPQWRPLYHFTPEQNWTNDPNGLIFLNGEFQLYYQHNPFENKWGHMSWGHASSKDLISWQHHPVAIPEVVSKDTTTWIYSGSAVLDKKNTSGFGINGNAPLVAIYTADQPRQKKESQYIAYSNDGGMSFQQYAKNPVIDLDKKDFRDPNVFWHEPTKQWIMTVAMVDEHMVRIYGSKNLKDWNKLSDFGGGYRHNPWECPSLLPLVVDNNPKKVKWALFVSSGGDHGPLIQYFVGDFDGEKFTDDNHGEKVLKVDYGDAYYAAIAWRDAPKNKKILLGWLQDGRRETYPWKGMMSIPHDLSLKTTPEGLVLIQEPASVLADAITKYAKGKPPIKTNLDLTDNEIRLTPKPLRGNAYWIVAEFEINTSKKLGFNVVSNTDGSKKVVVGYNALKQELFVDCSSAEKGNKSQSNWVQTAPMKAVKGIVKIQVLVDNSSLEVFGNGGEKVISTMIYPDNDATGLSAFAEGSAAIRSLKLLDLNK